MVGACSGILVNGMVSPPVTPLVHGGACGRDLDNTWRLCRVHKSGSCGDSSLCPSSSRKRAHADAFASGLDTRVQRSKSLHTGVLSPQGTDSMADMVRIVGTVIKEELLSNASLADPLSGCTPVHAVALPPIDVDAYASLLYQTSGCSASCFVLAWVYIQRTASLCSALVLRPLTAHRLLLTAVCIANKWVDDKPLSTQAWAAVGGVSVAEMQRLETWFCAFHNFSFFVSEAAFDGACSKLSLPAAVAQKRVNVESTVQAPAPLCAPVETTGYTPLFDWSRSGLCAFD